MVGKDTFFIACVMFFFLPRIVCLHATVETIAGAGSSTNFKSCLNAGIQQVTDVCSGSDGYMDRIREAGGGSPPVKPEDEDGPDLFSDDDLWDEDPPPPEGARDNGASVSSDWNILRCNIPSSCGSRIKCNACGCETGYEPNANTWPEGTRYILWSNPGPDIELCALTCDQDPTCSGFLWWYNHTAIAGVGVGGDDPGPTSEYSCGLFKAEMVDSGGGNGTALYQSIDSVNEEALMDLQVCMLTTMTHVAVQVQRNGVPSLQTRAVDISLLLPLMESQDTCPADFEFATLEDAFFSEAAGDTEATGNGEMEGEGDAGVSIPDSDVTSSNSTNVTSMNTAMPNTFSPTLLPTDDPTEMPTEGPTGMPTSLGSLFDFDYESYLPVDDCEDEDICTIHICKSGKSIQELEEGRNATSTIPDFLSGEMMVPNEVGLEPCCSFRPAARCQVYLDPSPLLDPFSPPTALLPSHYWYYSLFLSIFYTCCFMLLLGGSCLAESVCGYLRAIQFIQLA
jgi:hypothetical protein